MQRVSTAFVGQVSAASSPATAKLKGRAPATNDPASVPLASSHRAQSRRRRDLVAGSSSTHSAVARPCRSYSWSKCAKPPN